MRSKLVSFGAAVVVTCFAGCSHKPVLRLAAQTSSEQHMLTEIIAQHLERQLGVSVQRKLNVGDSAAALNAFLNGEFDLYPEYSGVAAQMIQGLNPSGPIELVRQQLEQEYRKRWNAEWIAPLGFDASYVIAVRRALADQYGLETLADVENQRGRTWRLAVSFEFFERPEYLKKFNRSYAILWEGAITTMEPNQLPHALAQGAADMIAAPRTVGSFAVVDAKFLVDTKGIFPPMEAGVVVSRQALRRFSGLESALQGLRGRISLETMRQLNRSLELGQEPASLLARKFLDAKSRGWISSP
ncbi:MAG: hypothetical protein NZV14_14355 [Bryobacteraceae bacterium]|nr:hypothetical protein [Bryobacteraceae bacterium]MDW8379344.1 glycine betaine ABC transporter substrate-binding protein [Bryobacterales bacterium]